MNINQIEVKGITYQVEDAEARSGLAQAVTDITTIKEELKNIPGNKPYTVIENTENLKIYFKEGLYSKNLLIHCHAYIKEGHSNSYQNGEIIYKLDKAYCPPHVMRGIIDCDTRKSDDIVRCPVDLDINPTGDISMYFIDSSVTGIVDNIIGFYGDINVVWIK